MWQAADGSVLAEGLQYGQQSVRSEGQQGLCLYTNNERAKLLQLVLPQLV